MAEQSHGYTSTHEYWSFHFGQHLLWSDFWSCRAKILSHPKLVHSFAKDLPLNLKTHDWSGKYCQLFFLLQSAREKTSQSTVVISSHSSVVNSSTFISSRMILILNLVRADSPLSSKGWKKAPNPLDAVDERCQTNMYDLKKFHTLLNYHVNNSKEIHYQLFVCKTSHVQSFLFFRRANCSWETSKGLGSTEQIKYCRVAKQFSLHPFDSIPPNSLSTIDMLLQYFFSGNITFVRISVHSSKVWSQPNWFHHFSNESTLNHKTHDWSSKFCKLSICYRVHEKGRPTKDNAIAAAASSSITPQNNFPPMQIVALWHTWEILSVPSSLTMIVKVGIWLGRIGSNH